MKSLIIISLIFLVSFGAVFPSSILAESGVINIYASVPGCGDAIIQSGEDCDGPNLNGQTCQTQNFFSGTLVCDSSCFFDTTGCTNTPPTPPSSGHGSGGGGSLGGVLTYYLPPYFLPPPNFQQRRADLNNDGKVDIVDLSIMLFWYNKPNPPPKIDLSSDGKVDLVDISIMLYYWTG